MKFIILTYTENDKVIEYTINCYKIHSITKYRDVTWISTGNPESDFKVDQTPQEILKLIRNN
jgi:hypothetical protein